MTELLLKNKNPRAGLKIVLRKKNVRKNVTPPHKFLCSGCVQEMFDISMEH